MRTTLAEPRLLLLAALVAAVASCGDNPLPPDPPAQCVVSTADASSNPASTDPSPPAGSPTVALVDDFAGAVVNTAKWSYYDSPPRTTQDDRLNIAVAPAGGYSGLVYRLPHRFAGSSFSAEVGRAATGGNLVETVVGIATPDDEEFILLTSFGGNIQAVYNWRDHGCNDPSHIRTFDGLEYCLLGSIAFDATAHRFRRLREQGGTVVLEFSPNGQSWTQPAGWSLTHRFVDAGALHGLIAAGSPRPYANTADAQFENVNTAVPAIPRELAASCTSNTEVRLTWERRAVNEAGFRVERRSGSGAFTEIGTVGANVLEFRDANARGGANYEYRVRAANATGSSGFTRVVTVRR